MFLVRATAGSQGSGVSVIKKILTHAVSGSSSFTGFHRLRPPTTVDQLCLSCFALAETYSTLAVHVWVPWHALRAKCKKKKEVKNMFQSPLHFLLRYLPFLQDVFVLNNNMRSPNNPGSYSQDHVSILSKLASWKLQKQKDMATWCI